MTLHEFLSKLSYAKDCHGYWMAKCCAHDDREASLSIKQGDKGIVLKCHAGCTSEAICAALGIELADLFPEREQAERKEIVATYDYRDFDGTLLFQVLRYE